MTTSQLEQSDKESKFSLALSFLACSSIAGVVMAVLIATGLLEVGWDRLVKAGASSLAVAAILMIPGKWSPRGLYCWITKADDAPNVNASKPS